MGGEGGGGAAAHPVLDVPGPVGVGGAGDGRAEEGGNQEPVALTPPHAAAILDTTSAAADGGGVAVEAGSSGGIGAMVRSVSRDELVAAGELEAFPASVAAHRLPDT